MGRISAMLTLPEQNRKNAANFHKNEEFAKNTPRGGGLVSGVTSQPSSQWVQQHRDAPTPEPVPPSPEAQHCFRTWQREMPAAAPASSRTRHAGSPPRLWPSLLHSSADDRPQLRETAPAAPAYLQPSLRP